jgi:ABC-type Zn2+ transport system substrate-binding protein/surface adhesin
MRRLPVWLICSVLAASTLCAQAQGRLNVVTSFSILADFARNVGGDRATVTSLIGPDSDVHVYTPAPADAKKVADARLLIVNGLGLEGWLPRLVQSSGSKAAIVTASHGIAPLNAGGAADPHAWQSVADAKIYVANIRDAFAAADPADAGFPRPRGPDRSRANPAGAPQGDLDPPGLRLFCRRLRHPIHRAVRRFHRFRAQRARYRRHHHPDQNRENPGDFPGEYQR